MELHFDTVCPSEHFWLLGVIFSNDRETFSHAILCEYVFARTLEVEWAAVKRSVVWIAENGTYTRFCARWKTFVLNSPLFSISKKVTLTLSRGAFIFLLWHLAYYSTWRSGSLSVQALARFYSRPCALTAVSPKAFKLRLERVKVSSIRRFVSSLFLSSLLQGVKQHLQK